MQIAPYPRRFWILKRDTFEALIFFSLVAVAIATSLVEHKTKVIIGQIGPDFDDLEAKTQDFVNEAPFFHNKLGFCALTLLGGSCIIPLF